MPSRSLTLLLVLIATVAADTVTTQQPNNQRINAIISNVQALANNLVMPPKIIDALKQYASNIGSNNNRFAANALKNIVRVNTVMPTDPNIAIGINNVDSFLSDMEDRQMRAPFMSGSYPLDLGKHADDVKAIERLRGKIQELQAEIDAPAPAEPKPSLTPAEKEALKKLKTEIANLKTAAKAKQEPTGLKPTEALMYDMLYRRVANVAKAAERRAPPKPQDPNKIQEELYKQLASEMRKLQQATLRRPRNTSNRDY